MSARAGMVKEEKKKRETRCHDDINSRCRRNFLASIGLVRAMLVRSFHLAVFDTHGNTLLFHWTIVVEEDQGIRRLQGTGCHLLLVAPALHWKVRFDNFVIDSRTKWGTTSHLSQWPESEQYTVYRSQTSVCPLRLTEDIISPGF